MRIFLISLAALASGACDAGRNHGDGGAAGDGGSTGNGLQITPADPVVAVDGTTSASLDFRVTRDGADLTSQASFFVDDASFGSFSGGTFHSLAGAAGKTQVHARLGSDLASTSLTLKVTAVVVAPGTPADAPNQFGGADDASLAPQVVYPPSGALVPPNFSELEVQWQPPAQTQLYELAFSGDAIDLKIYTTCPTVGAGCAFEPDEPTWHLLSGAGRGATVQLAMRATDGQGGAVGSSASQPLSFAVEDMQGGLYYWAAASGGIYRYDFGLRGQKAEAFYTPAQAGLGTMCVGCHALSRDGTRISVGMNIPEPSVMRMLDVATRKDLFDVGTGGLMGFPMGGSDFEAITADAKALVTTENGALSIRDATTGNAIGAAGAVPNADMPDISPDGTQVVFARGAGGGCQFGLCVTLSVQGASLITVPFTGAAFGAETKLVTSAGENNYYPAYSPDGSLVAFNRAAGDSYDAMDARVMVVSSTGGAPTDLSSVNGALGNSWPKWSPFIHHFMGSTIFWLTFSSRRPVGLRSTGNAQIWMVPIDPARAAAGQDSSFPPVWMPFQDATTGNHIAQWVEKVERQPCSQVDQGGCMSGEVCENGVCVPGIQ